MAGLEVLWLLVPRASWFAFHWTWWLTALVALYTLVALAVMALRIPELMQMVWHVPGRSNAALLGTTFIACFAAYMIGLVATTGHQYVWVMLACVWMGIVLMKLITDVKLWKPANPDALVGRIALVTGSNSGIGLATSLRLARLGASVVMAARSQEKADAAAAYVNARLKGGKGRAVGVFMDLESMTGVRDFVRDFRRRYTTLDILVNNAGMMPTAGQRTKDGFESGLGVMHFGHFLLTNLLRDYLEAPSLDGYVKRVINVSSAGHFTGKFDESLHQGDGEGDLRGEIIKGGITSYGRAKLANVLLTRELQRQWDSAGIKSVVSHSLHPGAVITPIWLAMPTAVYLFFKPIATLGYRAPSQAAAQLCSLIVDDFAVKKAPLYLHGGTSPAPSSKLSRNEQLARRLWQVSERVTGLAATSTTSQ